MPERRDASDGQTGRFGGKEGVQIDLHSTVFGPSLGGGIGIHGTEFPVSHG